MQEYVVTRIAGERPRAFPAMDRSGGAHQLQESAPVAPGEKTIENRSRQDLSQFEQCLARKGEIVVAPSQAEGLSRSSLRMQRRADKHVRVDDEGGR